MMDQAFVAGLVTLGAPLLLVALFFRRSVAILLFYLVLLAVGIGYLTSTGAVSDIGHFALDTLGMGGDEAVLPTVPPPEKMPAPAPAP